jgi:hypothetical protein
MTTIAIAKNRDRIGINRTEIGTNRAAIVHMRTRIEPYRAISDQIGPRGEKAMRYHPNVADHIPVSREIYSQLNLASVHTAFQKETWEIAAEAIEEWTCRHDPDALAMSNDKGYQWKQLFLPDGTLLRTVYKGKNHHCLVEEDHLLYEGKSVSPSRFVNAVGGIRRNAWTSIWVRFPNTCAWQLADTLRTRVRPRHERRERATAKPAPAPMPRAPLADPPPAPAVQRKLRFKGRTHRTAVAKFESKPFSIQDVSDALRRAEAQGRLASPNQNTKSERLFVAWFGCDELFGPLN